MLYIIKRLFYDIFCKGSIVKKSIILICLILLMLFSPQLALAEEVGGVVEISPTETTEPIPPIEDIEEEEEKTPVIIVENNNDEILEYLKEQEKKQQEKLQAQLLYEEEQAQVRALTQNQNNIIYGYLNNYRYYVTCVERTNNQYNQYNQHIWVFSGFPLIDINENNEIEIIRGKCEYIKVDYDSNVTITGNCNNINDYDNYTDIYSNITALKYPSVYQIDKNPLEVLDILLNVFVQMLVLWGGFTITNFVINGPRNGRKHL